MALLNALYVLVGTIDNKIFGPTVGRYQLSQGMILKGDDRNLCLVVEGYEIYVHVV